MRQSGSILLTLLEGLLFSYGPAPHVSDDGLSPLIHMDVLDADNLRATVPQAPACSLSAS